MIEALPTNHDFELCWGFIIFTFPIFLNYNFWSNIVKYENSKINSESVLIYNVLLSTLELF